MIMNPIIGSNSAKRAINSSYKGKTVTPKIITLNNIMAHNGSGWFPATLSNCTWQSSTRIPGDGAKSSVKIIPSGSGECSLTSGKHDLVASHKYYISFKVYYESAANCTFDWYWPIAEPSAAAGLRVNAAANVWTRVSAVFTRKNFTDGSYPCRFDYNNEANNVPIWFTSCMLFDLTDGFGAGNEPSKEWMDMHVDSFGDTKQVHYFDNLIDLFNDIANAIQTKSGESGEIFACDFAERIKKATTGSNPIWVKVTSE